MRLHPVDLAANVASTARFLADTKPEVAVCSLGSRATYKHPHTESRDRLHAAGAYIQSSFNSRRVDIIVHRV
jgi:beta-lactamase superfamily II metal-dependent hydrolase